MLYLTTYSNRLITLPWMSFLSSLSFHGQIGNIKPETIRFSRSVGPTCLLLLRHTKPAVVLLNPPFTSRAVWAPQKLARVVLLLDLGEARIVWSVKGRLPIWFIDVGLYKRNASRQSRNRHHSILGPDEESNSPQRTSLM